MSLRSGAPPAAAVFSAFLAASAVFAACGSPAAGRPPAAHPSPSPAESAQSHPSDVRRIAVRAPAAFARTPEAARLGEWAERRGIRIEYAGETEPVPTGWEALRVGISPVSPDLSRRLARFGVRGDPSGFGFDGRTYAAAEDAIAVRDPAAPQETLVLGNTAPAALRMLARGALFREGGGPAPSDYQVVSGGLVKSGRFVRPAEGAKGTLAVDRRSDRDEIAEREQFLRSLVTVEREGVRWQFAERDRGAMPRLEAILSKHRRPGAAAHLTVRIFPDAAMKANGMGSSRPADVSREGDGAAARVRVDVDASAPGKPDLVAPVLAAAALAAESPKLLDRPSLLLALGARAVGRLWERDVPGFEAFARRAGVDVSPAELLHGQDDVSPILAVGCAAAWLDAGTRTEGEEATLRAAVAPESALLAALARWKSAAAGARFTIPPARSLPTGFLRGVSYAMANSIQAGYASPRSHETLARLVGLGTSSISVMPFAYQPDASQPAIAFVHRNPQGETDEGTVHAVADARALGMTAMVKPQIWVGHGAFTGAIAMASEADWAKWFASYRRFAIHHALVAEASGADMYCIGTELVGTESRAREWRELAAAVRLATGAPLTYAANWASGAMKVPFWDALDAIGVDFYDPLSGDPAATDAQLEAGARAAARPLDALARRTKRPVIFTEAGYPLARSAWLTPHDENSGRPPSAGDAARAMTALSRALEKETWWKGIYWWKAFSSGRDARPDERGFNVLGGAPEKAMAESFARLAREGRS